MSSGRDIHSQEYHVNSEQEFRKRHEYLHESYASTPFQPALPGLGLLPSHTPARDLTHNWIDVESTLLGIGSNDLVHPSRSQPTLPEYKKMPTLNMVDPAPLFLPGKTDKPEPNQRLRYYLGGQTIQPRWEHSR